MSRTADHFGYVQHIRRRLLGAGIDGISQHKLNQLTRTKIFGTSDLLEVLNAWRDKRWVQSFKVQQYSKRPTTVWRATELLRDEFGSVQLVDPTTATVAED